MTLGKPGGAAAPDYFYQPNDVLVRRTATSSCPKDTAAPTRAS